MEREIETKCIHLEKVVASLENGGDASDLSDYADPCGCSKGNSGKERTDGRNSAYVCGH